MYLDRTWCGRGIGRVLLPALIARCEAGPWRQMIAVIGDTANTASIALHRRCGFEPVGYKFGRRVDLLRMQRARPRGSQRSVLSVQRARRAAAAALGGARTSRVPTRTMASITGTSSRPSGVSV